jgi:dihydrofolate reductase
MTRIIANVSLSLDGFVANPQGGVDELFEWYGTGPVEVVMPGEHPARFASVSAASAEVLGRQLARLGALVTGRRLFDIAKGWGGAHPAGVPVVVVTHREPTDWAHPDAPFAFETGGVHRAVERAVELAGGRDVAVASADVIQQCLAAGLLDEITVDLVPVLFGTGVRLFGELAGGHVLLEDPTVVPGTRVTHLGYRVRRDPGGQPTTAANVPGS